MNLTDSKISTCSMVACSIMFTVIILSLVIDENINLSVQSKFELLKTSTPVPFALGSSSGSSLLKMGFHQVESDDFIISKFILNTDKIQLSGNHLVHLEHFWDSILCVFNTMCSQNQVYPCYCDLKHDFDFHAHICENSHLSSTEMIQAKLNF